MTGQTVHRAKNGRYYVKLANGRCRFISNSQAGKKGKGVLSGLLGSIGLGRKRKPKKGGKRKVHRKRGGDIFGDLMNMGSSALPIIKMLAGGRKKKHRGGDFLHDFGNGFVKGFTGTAQVAKHILPFLL